MSAAELVHACYDNKLPSISTITKYGLDGNGGTNPIYIFKCYREAITKDGITDCVLEKFFQDGKINQLILENSHSVKYLSCYENVLQKGGIKTSWNCTHLECPKCKRCADHPDNQCTNCGTTVKK